MNGAPLQMKDARIETTDPPVLSAIQRLPTSWVT